MNTRPIEFKNGKSELNECNLNPIVHSVEYLNIRFIQVRQMLNEMIESLGNPISVKQVAQLSHKHGLMIGHATKLFPLPTIAAISVRGGSILTDLAENL